MLSTSNCRADIHLTGEWSSGIDKKKKFLKILYIIILNESKIKIIVSKK